MKPIPRPNAHKELAPKPNANEGLIQTGEQFSPEFGITVHGRTPDGTLIVDLPKPRVTGPGILKQHVAECLAADRAKAAEKKDD